MVMEKTTVALRFRILSTSGCTVTPALQNMDLVLHAEAETQMDNDVET
jgi:hypothetical protein